MSDSTPLLSADHSATLSPSTTCSARLRPYHDAVAALIACLSAASMGLVLGYSCPSLLDPNLLFILDNDDRRTWFSSLVTLGAIAGGPLAALGVGHVGRKGTLLLTSLPLAAGWIMISFPFGHLALLYTGRILTGVAMGAISLAAPLYITEVSSRSHRGALGASFQLLVTVGILLVYSLGLVLRWDWLALVGVGVAAVGAALLLGVPESPVWLVGRGEPAMARRALSWLSLNADEEYGEIERSEAATSGRGQRLGARDLLQRGVLRPLLLTLALMSLQQFSGINAVIFYSAQLFQSSGFSINPILPSIIVAAILFLFTALSCVLMDRAGRRVLLVVSGGLMGVSACALGGYYRLAGANGGYEWLSLGSVCLFVAGFSIGWGPVPWLVMGEILPLRVRGPGSGAATLFNWGCAFVVTKWYVAVAAAVTPSATFFGFGVINLVGAVFVGLLLPETKGRSLEEIEGIFDGRA